MSTPVLTPREILAILAAAWTESDTFAIHPGALLHDSDATIRDLVLAAWKDQQRIFAIEAKHPD